MDFLKLFTDKRLSVNEPEHLSFIKGTLASMKIDNPPAYENFSAFYGVEIETKVTKEPKIEVKEVEKPKKISKSSKV